MAMIDRTVDAGSLAASEIVQILSSGKSRTRSELAEMMLLARPTVALRVEPLIQIGLITASADTTSTGGRRSMRLSLASGSRVVVAADIGTTHVRVALTDLASVVLASRSVEQDVRHDPQAVLSWVADAAESMLAELGRTRSEIVGVGVGVPAPVDQSTGRPASPPFMPAWDDFDIPGWFLQRLGRTATVDNDVNVMAVGERHRVWPEVDHFLFVKVASGIGAGIISGGILQRGHQGIAGDIGHVQIPRAAGVLCHCGNTGCLAAVASGDALARALTASGTPASSSRDVVALVKDGNLDAIAAVRQAGYDIGEVLTSATSFINPAVIAIGGSLGAAGEHLLAGIRGVVYTKSMPLAVERLSIVEAHTRGDAGIIGASIVAVQHAFSPQGIRGILDAEAGPGA